MNKKITLSIVVGGILIVIAAVLLTTTSFFTSTPSSSSSSSVLEKVYIALEGTGEIVVMDTKSQKIIKRISLIEKMGNQEIGYMPHNVQVAPNGKSVLVTANAMSMEEHSVSSWFRFIPIAQASEGHSSEDKHNDQVIVIDPSTDTIIKRISLGNDLHVSHVVITPDNSYALVAAQEAGKLFKINTQTYAIEKEIAVPTGSEPHGLRISPDGKTAYVAMLQGKSLGILDIATLTMHYVSLPGAAVQTGITPNGSLVVISLYDTKALAVYNPNERTTSTIALPTEAKGPIQMYITPDSRYVYLADQGYYFDQPQNNKVYKIDLKEKKVVKEITVGDAPHGVVISKDGAYVYITNLVSNDVSIIDTQIDKEIARIPVGKMPNGISMWNKNSGGTP